MTNINNEQSNEKNTNVQQSIKSRLNLISANLEIIRTYLSVVDKAVANNNVDMAYSYTTLAGEQLETIDGDIKKIINALVCYSIEQNEKVHVKELDRIYICDCEKCPDGSCHIDPPENACRRTTDANHSLTLKETGHLPTLFRHYGKTLDSPGMYVEWKPEVTTEIW